MSLDSPPLFTRHRIEDHEDEIREMKAQNKSSQEIGDKLGFTRTGILLFCKRKGIEKGRSQIAKGLIPPPPQRRDPEKEWTRLLKGRRFNDGGVSSGALARPTAPLLAAERVEGQGA